MPKGIHRLIPGSKSERRIVQAKGARLTTDPMSPENQVIEDKRKAELAARKMRRQK